MSASTWVPLSNGNSLRGEYAVVMMSYVANAVIGKSGIKTRVIRERLEREIEV